LFQVISQDRDSGARPVIEQEGTAKVFLKIATRRRNVEVKVNTIRYPCIERVGPSRNKVGKSLPAPDQKRGVA
jgi:hypothetical protein